MSWSVPAPVSNKAGARPGPEPGVPLGEAQEPVQTACP
jgi:hypothetical protein